MSSEPRAVGFIVDRTRVTFDLTGKPLDAAGLVYITEKGLFGKQDMEAANIMTGLAARAAEQINNGQYPELIVEALQRLDAVIPFLEVTAAESIKFGAEIFGLQGIFGADQMQIALHATAVSMLGLFSRSKVLATEIRKQTTPEQRYANIVYVKQALRINAFANILNGHYDFVEDLFLGSVPQWEEMTTKTPKLPAQAIQES